MSPRHQEALGHLLYGTGQHGGFVQLTGEVGTGKTTIVRTLLEQRLADVDVAMVHNPRQSEMEFVQSICDELHVRYDAPVTLKTLVDALNSHLLKSHAEGRRTVLIIDEAQNLRPEVLEQVRLLTNLETTKDKLLRIMLIGQPELSELLARPDLRQLAQRITARFHLTPLSAAETTEYIQHRLRVAGAETEIFSRSACQQVHRYARGIPRLINIICDRALLGAYSQGQRQITPEMIRNAAREAIGELPTTFDPGAPKRWASIETVSALALAVCTLAFLYTFVIAPRLQPPAAANAPVPAAVAAAPASGSPSATGAAAAPPLGAMPASQLDQLLRRPQPLPEVMGRLVRLWDPQLRLPRGGNPCEALSRDHLECYRSNGSWSDLGQINRPAILVLKLAGGEQHALLRELTTTHAGFDTQFGVVKVALSELDKLWTGDYLLLWRRDTAESQLRPGDRSASVPLVWERLAELDGVAIPPEVKTYFGRKLEDAIRQFQQQRGLPVDGMLGTRTLIALGDGQASTPTLLGASR
ncbi:ExeA family protein [Solimonas sp. K1W22B-7]|uniref:ExeA family protein n=1 Tax=Solimonas sp. K1W22B-7 TaxID=2303331 RepID=UPI001F098F9B|nr:ExeA family protein [Solimonas sp. K1W22B-7]